MVPSPAPGIAVVVLQELGDVVVVHKPPGVLVHNSRWAGGREATLVEAVRQTLGDDLRPVHRLDRQTSGCVLFARGPDATHRWQEALARDGAHKRYLALVRGHVREQHDIDHALRDADAQRGDETRKPARTLVTPRACSTVERCSLVDAMPRTGRTHQVRRHLKHISHPVLGDANYGKGALNRDFRARYGLHRLALHCAELLVTDDRGDVVEANAPLPDDLLAVVRQLFDDLDTESAAGGAKRHPL
jgi:tRNA pseudouridine65 synthase